MFTLKHFIFFISAAFMTLSCSFGMPQPSNNTPAEIQPTPALTSESLNNAVADTQKNTIADVPKSTIADVPTNTIGIEAINRKTINQVKLAKEILTNTLKETDPKDITLVLDIDDTCIQSPNVYNILHKDDEYDMLKPPAIEPVLDLVLWAESKKIKIYFLTSRLEKMRAKDLAEKEVSYLKKKCYSKADVNGYIDIKLLHVIGLINAGFKMATVENVICRTRGDIATNQDVGEWKQDHLKKLAANSFALFLDDNPAYINYKDQAQIRIPSLLFP